jgi:hypothetical protein
MQLNYRAQRALTRAATRPDKTVITTSGQVLMDLTTAGLVERAFLTPAGEQLAGGLIEQEHLLDDDACFAALAPGHPARVAA